MDEGPTITTARNILALERRELKKEINNTSMYSHRFVELAVQLRLLDKLIVLLS